MDLFRQKNSYSFDYAVMFISMLQQNTRFYYIDKKDENNPMTIKLFSIYKTFHFEKFELGWCQGDM
jgi:hypothetical protein